LNVPSLSAHAVAAALFLMTTMVLPAAAQERPVRWSLQLPDSGATGDSALVLRLHAAVDAGWYLYAQDQPAGGPSSLEIEAGSGFLLAGVEAPRPRTYADRNFDLFTRIYRESTSFTVRLGDADAAGVAEVRVTFQACTERYCLPARTDTVRLGLAMVPQSSPATAVPRAPSSAPLPAALQPEPESVPAPEPAPEPTIVVDAGAFDEGPPIQRGASVRLGSTGASLTSFLWLAVLMGALSLLTPCVFPMVPITVGFFAHRAGQGTAVKNAVAYGAGIVATFTALGLLVSIVFGAGGVVRMASDPWLNLAVAALFIAFALNLLGVYEIRLPQRVLAHATGAGARRSDATAAVLMGGAFSVTSFTCTAPFVGTLLVLAAQGDWRWPLLGMSVFAAAFALPFVLLALMPERLSRLPRAGTWMTTLKATIGVVELAAAVKFISNADLVWHWGVFTRSVVIVCWMLAAAALMVLFLRGARRRPWPRLGAAALAAAVVVWLGTGLRGYRLGELEAFLPPAPEDLLLARAGSGELPWRLNDYDGTLRAAQAAGRPVIIDFTGYTCTNCRWMEANMFPRSEVRELLGEYVRVRLYTDGRGEPYHAQQRLQERLYGTVALPYYAVLGPDGRTRATFLGMTRDTREFVQFLHDGLDGHTPAPTP
jgi:thiol:disulfide interchange protein